MSSDLWKKTKLGEIAQVSSGYSFKSEEFGDEGIPVIKINNVRNGFVDLSDAQYVDNKYLELEDNTFANYEEASGSKTG